MFKIMRNKALHQTAIPLRSIAAIELGRYSFKNKGGFCHQRETQF